MQTCLFYYDQKNLIETIFIFVFWAFAFIANVYSRMFFFIDTYLNCAIQEQSKELWKYKLKLDIMQNWWSIVKYGDFFVVTEP